MRIVKQQSAILEYLGYLVGGVLFVAALAAAILLVVGVVLWIQTEPISGTIGAIIAIGAFLGTLIYLLDNL